MRQSEARSTASIRLVWPFLELTRRAGYPNAGKGVAKALGLSEEQLNDPDTRVAQTRLADLLARLIEKSGKRDIGLHAARYVDSAHVGIPEYIARSRPTLQQAIESAVRYTPLLGDVAHHSLTIKGRFAFARLWLAPEIGTQEAAYEYLVALAVLLARRITGIAELAPIEVHFTHREPAETALHDQVFRCRLRFGMPVTQVLMTAECLAMPTAFAEPALGKLLETQADAMLEGLPRGGTLVAQVRALLRAEQSLRGTSAGRTAKQCGMSMRTLSRKLGAEGTSYRALVDEVRKELAFRELTRSTRSIAEIAYALGFASNQGFHRAFCRWTGTTPSDYRAAASGRSRSPTTEAG